MQVNLSCKGPDCGGGTIVQNSGERTYMHFIPRILITHHIHRIAHYETNQYDINPLVLIVSDPNCSTVEDIMEKALRSADDSMSKANGKVRGMRSSWR